MCFCGLIWLDELQIAIGLGGIEESEELGTEHGYSYLVIFGRFGWMQKGWGTCMARNTFCPSRLSMGLGYSWVSFSILEAFSGFSCLESQVSLFCLAFVLS